jgi:hypothetical protein
MGVADATIVFDDERSVVVLKLVDDQESLLPAIHLATSVR